MDRCIVRGNRTTSNYGCLFQYGAYSGHMTIRNSLFYDNYAAQRGIIYLHDVGLLDIENCTIVSNDVGNYGAIYMDMNPSMYVTCRVVNAVMYSNNNWNVKIAGGETLIVSNSCSSHTDYIPDFAANNNITNNPRFANFAADNFRLGNGSPCINEGINLDWSAGALDLDGQPRLDVFTGSVDMGCYEYAFHGTTITIR